MNGTFIKAVRWILVMPVSIAAYFIGYKLFMWANAIAGMYFMAQFMSIFGCGFSAACFVMSGSYTAPYYKNVVSIVLATVGSMVSIYAIAMALNSNDVVWWELLQYVANVIGCIVGSIYMHEEILKEEE